MILASLVISGNESVDLSFLVTYTEVVDIMFFFTDPLFNKASQLRRNCHLQ